MFPLKYFSALGKGRIESRTFLKADEPLEKNHSV